jgi:rhodanese-related sulfurtransferase
MAFQNIPVDEVKRRMDAGERFRLIDVREEPEFAICQIAGAELRPMSRINEWWQELDKDEPIVLFCHHGGRSAQVAHALTAQAGFRDVSNMAGGIEAWSLQVDPSVPRY